MQRNKDDWRIRLLLWVARRIVKVPIIVDFTPEDMKTVYAIGFAWTQFAADRMRGDDMLIERARRAEALANINAGSRKVRRTMNRAATKAAKRELANLPARPGDMPAAGNKSRFFNE
jgi:hypothetical protein